MFVGGILLVAMSVGGCSSDMDGPSPVYVDNRTSGPLELSLHLPSNVGADDIESVESIPAGVRDSLFGPYDDDHCLTGTIHATRNGQTIATIEQPCMGTHWEITDQGASQAP